MFCLYSLELDPIPGEKLDKAMKRQIIDHVKVNREMSVRWEKMRGGGKVIQLGIRSLWLTAEYCFCHWWKRSMCLWRWRSLGEKPCGHRTHLFFFLVLLFSPCTQRSVKSGSVLIRGMKIESTAYIKLLHCAGRLKEVKLLLYADGIHHNL